ncbi:uncharacterized protein [Dysidea avara]|uniref:uncharacterized protein n=1 Tax=Dysidea avara TaxID=196820 RepID=UPI00332BDBEB
MLQMLDIEGLNERLKEIVLLEEVAAATSKISSNSRSKAAVAATAVVMVVDLLIAVIVDTLTNPTTCKTPVVSSVEPTKNERSPSVVEQLMMSSNKKRDQSLMEVALIPQEDQMLLEVKSRNMTTIKPNGKRRNIRS